MKRTERLQETRKMRFEEAYEGYRRGSLTQAEAALLLGVCDRTFRRYMNRYDEGGLDALLDKRLVQILELSHFSGQFFARLRAPHSVKKGLSQFDYFHCAFFQNCLGINILIPNVCVLSYTKILSR